MGTPPLVLPHKDSEVPDNDEAMTDLDGQWDAFLDDYVSNSAAASASTAERLPSQPSGPRATYGRSSSSSTEDKDRFL